jgi:hypothetical protein
MSDYVNVPDTALVLEIAIGAPVATNTVTLAKWRGRMAGRAAVTLPIVAGLLLEAPGTVFVPDPPPETGELYKGFMVTKALLFPLQQGHVKYLMGASDQLKALHNLILSCLGHDAKAMLENNTLYIDNKLHIASDSKVHHLLKALHQICSTREGSTPEESLANLQDDIINLKMGDLTFSPYMELVKAQCDAVRATGVIISEAQEVVYAVRGLEGVFLPIKDALVRAAAIAGTGLPATRAAFRAAVVRIEPTVGNEGSAFSAKVDNKSKRPNKAEKEDRGGEEKTYRGEEKIAFDAGFKKGAKKGDARVKTAEEELTARSRSSRQPSRRRREVPTRQRRLPGPRSPRGGRDPCRPARRGRTFPSTNVARLTRALLANPSAAPTPRASRAKPSAAPSPRASRTHGPATTPTTTMTTTGENMGAGEKKGENKGARERERERE